MESAPCRNRLWLGLLAVALLTMVVPPTAYASGGSQPATEPAWAHRSAETSTLSWQPTASPAAAFALDVGATPTMTLLATDAGNMVRTDGGDSWSQLPEPQPTVASVAVDPTDPDVGYIGGYGGLLRTTDGGQTFEKILAVDHVSLMATSSSGALAVGLPDDSGLDIRISHDRGDTWETVNWPFDAPRMHGLAFGETDENLVLTSKWGHTWVTPDAGDSWTVHEGQSGASLASEPDGTLWMGEDGTAQRSTDGGLTWTDVEAPHTPKALTPKPGGGVFAATSEGFYQTTDGTTWTDMGHADLSAGATGLAADPADPQAVLVADEDLGIGQLSPADDGDGFTYEGRTTGLPPVEVTALSAAPDGSALLAGTDHGLYLAEPGSGTFPHAGAGLGKGAVRSAAAAPGGDVLYAGGSNPRGQGFLHVSDDGGESWELVYLVSSQSLPRAIDVHPTDEQRAWVGLTVSGGDDRLYETTDAGSTWTPVARVADGELTDIGYDANRDRVVVTSTSGVHAYDPANGQMVPIGANSASATATTANAVYTGGPTPSLWSDTADPTGQGAILLPWAQTGEDVQGATGWTGSDEHVLTRSSSGTVHHCTPTDDGARGDCQTANLPTGAPSSLATGPDGQVWAGTPDDGIYRALLE